MSSIYLYGFVHSGAAMPAGGLLGVADAPVELLDVGGFAAAIGRIDAPEFQREAIEERSGDVEWMAEQGLAHEQVVAWFVDHSTIVPARLLTLFSDDTLLRQQAERDAPRIGAELERFAAAREWDLKVGYDRGRLASHLGEVSDEIARLDRQIAEATPGRRYLLERKREDLARTESGAVARRLAAALLETLQAHTADVARLPSPAADTPVLLNAALLVPRDNEDALLSAAGDEKDRLEEIGITIQLTGPWAPYRFVGATDAE